MRKVLVVIMILALYASFAEAAEWTCPTCGAENGGNFCTQCGTKKPEEIVCPSCGERYPASSGVKFCGSCGTQLRGNITSGRKYEGEWFATPEDAVKCYLDGLKNLNFEQMLSAFAWETQAKHYSVSPLLKRTRYYMSSIRPRMPSSHDFLIAANLHSLRSNQIDLIYASIESYILGDALGEYGNIRFISDEEVDAFLKKYDNGKLEKLTAMSNIRFLAPESVNKNFSNERVKTYLIRRAEELGADEVVNVVAVADVKDEMLIFCPTVGRYGSKWHLVSVSSYIGALLNLKSNQEGFYCGSLSQTTGK